MRLNRKSVNHHVFRCLKIVDIFMDRFLNSLITENRLDWIENKYIDQLFLSFFDKHDSSFMTFEHKPGLVFFLFC